jgi:hypothetical protein
VSSLTAGPGMAARRASWLGLGTEWAAPTICYWLGLGRAYYMLFKIDPIFDRFCVTVGDFVSFISRAKFSLKIK